MKRDGARSAGGEPCGGVASLTYDAHLSGQSPQAFGQGVTIALTAQSDFPATTGNGGKAAPSARQGQAGRAISEHTFEFRLSGSER
jgi:hypothetical protein